MTTRPGQMPEDLLRFHRSKQLAQCLTITAKDGSVLRLTDHDRALTVEQQTFAPMVVGSLSADRREGALRAGDQDVRGFVDGTVISLPKLTGQQFESAIVSIVVVDWCRPAIIYARFKRKVTNLRWDGSSFNGTMQGMSEQLRKPSGGQFGGVFTTTCPYQLGNEFCGKDLSAYTVSAAVVDSVIDSYSKLRFTTASFAPTQGQSDGFFRDGSITWTSGDNDGHVSPIVEFQWSTRECELLIPTPRPMQVGDTAKVLPGCDGLFSTCKTKYNNAANFGGDNLQPTASDLRQQVVDE